MNVAVATETDWARLARPQPDGYDTRAILDLVTRGSNPWRRRGVEGAPTLFGGRVAVRNRDFSGFSPPQFVPAPPDHPHLAEAETILSAWPEAAAQIPELIDTIQVWSDTTQTAALAAVRPGSSSHSIEEEFGTIMVTIDSPFGTAQALVHEMAHHKLRAMGVPVVGAARLVANDPAGLYRSPIIVGRLRPMTAVLHAQYSFMHVTQLDVADHDAPGTSDRLRGQSLYLLARNVPRMEAGDEELRRHLATDAAGARFAEAFFAWSAGVLQRGRAILDASGYGIPPL
jgi:HEXXH motif-containing protein